MKSVKIDLYRLGEQVTPNDESDSSLGNMLVMHREYAYSWPIVRVQFSRLTCGGRVT